MSVTASTPESDSGVVSIPENIHAGRALRARAASGKSIRFMTQNGGTLKNVPPQSFEIPRLVLFYNGVLTDPTERSITIDLDGFEVPPGGAVATIELETQHEDPMQQRILVWSESISIPNPSDKLRSGESVSFTHEFTGTVSAGPDSVITTPMLTPTDYYRIRITLQAARLPALSEGQTGAPQKINRDYALDYALDYAFLLENVWSVPLPQVRETSPGAAPHRLVVYFCDMFLPPVPLQDSHSRRAGFAGLIQDDLIPHMIDAYRTQTDVWQFPWHSEWTSYRQEDEDGVLSVALSDGETWFHGPAPSLGNAEISIKVEEQDEAGGISTLAKLMSVFHHELFHNLQRNINQHVGGNGDVDGKDDAWAFFSEGMAMLAASVGQPSVEFGPGSWEDSYIWKANQLIMWGMSSKPEEMNPYQGALYWRFLYEQCGGMQGGIEDPAAGMQVIRQTLKMLYSRESVDISSTGELTRYLPLVMDRSLQDSSCPFHNYADSLVAFARAIYSLRLQDGRCIRAGLLTDCGLYDPNRLYALPPAAIYTYYGTAVTFSAGNQLAPTGNENSNDFQSGLGPTSRESAPIPLAIRSGFGMSFVEIRLDPSAGKGPLAIEFSGVPGEQTRFHVEVWELADEAGDAKPRKISDQVASLDTISGAGSEGHFNVVLPEIDPTVVNRLALIITRLDGQDEKGISGEYYLALHPTAGDGSLP